MQRLKAWGQCQATGHRPQQFHEALERA
jgi:hypothetical protein